MFHNEPKQPAAQPANAVIKNDRIGVGSHLLQIIYREAALGMRKKDQGETSALRLISGT